MYQVVSSGLGRMGLRGKMFWTCQVCGACYIFIQAMMSSMELDIWVLRSKGWSDKCGHLQHECAI